MSTGAPRFAVIGVNHRSASLGLRDSLFVDDAGAAAFLVTLKARGLPEALVLSTCDRVEVWASHHDLAAPIEIVGRAFAERAGIEPAALSAQLYTLAGGEAVRHAFAVTSSLDSLIVGEPHVLGQVKAAHRLAREAGTLGPELDVVLQAAFSTAKRVRTETAVGEGPVSIAAAAAQLARDVHGDLSRCRALLVGAGDMGELIVESLQAAGLKWMVATAPRATRAESVATALGGTVAPFEELKAQLAESDIVVTALGGRAQAVTAEHVTFALKKRRRKPIFLIDAGIPGDVEPSVNRLDGAFLYDLSDLERVALEGRAGREQAARAAWAVLDDELGAFLKGRAARAAVPAIVALRQKFEEAREASLAEAGGDAAEATRLLVNRLLHAPSEEMKEMAAHGAAEGAEWRAMEKALRKMFRLD